MKLEIPKGVRYSCSQCGDCCRTWNVLLGPGEKERIEALDWEGREQRLVGERVSVALDRPGRFRLAHRESGSCVFLGDHQRCLIHEHFGAEVKPLLCRLYPFGFYPLGDRVGVDINFACKAVSVESGGEVDERLPEWALLLEQVDGVRDPRTHELDRRKPVDANTLWELEHGVVGLLGNNELSFLNRVRAALMFLDLGTTGDPSTPLAGELRAALLATLPRRVREEPRSVGMEKSQRALFRQLLYLAINPVPLGFDTLTPLHREHLQGERLAAGQEFRDGQGEIVIGGKPSNATWQSLSMVNPREAFGDRKVASFAARYFITKIIGQKFLQVGNGEVDFVTGLRLLLLRAPMAVWLAKMLAAETGKVIVESVHVREAFRILDRSPVAFRPEDFPKDQARVIRFMLEETQLILAALEEELGLAGK